MLAYKVATSNGTRVIITLEIPPDAVTNIDRYSIIDKFLDTKTASHRANKVKVLKIEGKDGILFDEATSAFYKRKKLTYRVGEVVEEPKYNYVRDEVHTRGIHFFLTKEVAEMYGLKKVQNGIYKQWFPFGRIKVKGEFKDGERVGLWHDYDPDGTSNASMYYDADTMKRLHGYW